jgi:exonuclease SbcC
MNEIEASSRVVAGMGYRPRKLRLKGFRGIKDGLGRDEITLDLDALAANAQLVAIAGLNGRGKTTVIDSLVPFTVMPSRAGADGLGAFSYYDHVFLPESEKELLWEHDGVTYKSHLVFRVNGKRKTEAFLLQQDGDGWRPVRLPDGTVSDGKVDTYEQCVQGILGSAETFFTSVFSAQGKRQLSAYKNGEIKALLADLLGLDEVRAQGARAAETAKLLKNGLNLIRHEQARAANAIRALQQDIEKADHVEANVEATARAKHGAADALDRTRDAKADVTRQAQAAQAATEQRAELNAQRAAAVSTFSATNTSFEQRERREAERARTLKQSIADRRRQFGERRSALLAQTDAQRRNVDAARRAGWALRRLPVAHQVVAARAERDAAAQARADRATVLRHGVQGLNERLGGIEREAGQAALRQGELARRFGLTAQVPCAGTDLQGRCQLLSDAHEAQALRPSVDAQLMEFAARKAVLQAELHAATAELEGLIGAAEARNEAERRLEATAQRKSALEVHAARSAELQQAQAALAATQATLAAIPLEAEPETPEEVAQRRDIEQALAAIATERQSAAQTFAAATARMDLAIAALPPAFDQRRLEAAQQSIDQAARALAQAEASALEAVRQQERLRALRGQLGEAQTAASAANARAAGVEKALGAWTLFAKCLSNDGIIALDIDDAGPTLAALANDLLLACYGHRFTVEIRTLVETAKGESREGFDIVVHDAQSSESKSVTLMSAGERVWVNEAMTRAIALYLSQNTDRRYATLFSDEADGPLDPHRKRMFMDMKRAVLRLGGYRQEFFVSQTPELTAMADAVIDMDALVTSEREAA